MLLDSDKSTNFNPRKKNKNKANTYVLYDTYDMIQFYDLYDAHHCIIQFISTYDTKTLCIQ